jgi:hypothetical protein
VITTGTYSSKYQKMDNRIKDITGQTFGKWTVIEYVEARGKRAFWLCVCSCGKERLVSGVKLRRGDSRGCGCSEKESLIGERFNLLTVIEEASLTKDRKRRVLFKCDCGRTKIIEVHNLKTGHTKSCGHLIVEEGKKRVKHGKTKTSEYKSWLKMKDRCYVVNDISYPNYGGRGIKVCDRWRHSFENFYADMGDKPSRKHTLERKNSNEDYTPDNCVWDTWKVQNGNRTNNVWIEHNGKRMILQDWANYFGAHQSNLRWHMRRRTFDEIITFFKNKNSI